MLEAAAPRPGFGTESPRAPTGEDRKRLINRVRYDLARAQGKKTKLNARAAFHRKVLDLDPKTRVPYEGAPDITMPLMRSKRDGVVAHLSDALDVEPFFSADGFTSEAQQVAPIYEALMEHELNRGNGREQYLMTARESVDTGTGILGWTIALGPDNEPIIQETMTRFENFYAYPVAVDNFDTCSTFRYYKQPWFVLDELAEAGLLDRELVDKMHEGGGGGEAETFEESRDANRDGEFSPEQELHELWECYVRWRGELWRVVFSQRMNDALDIRPNPFREAFDAVPFEPLRVIRKPGYLWGHSIPMLLEAIQKIMDNAQNTRMAYNQMAISPILMADRMNPFTRQLEQGGIAPGMVIKTLGSPDLNGVKVLEFPPPNVTIEDMELAQRFADLATFTDFQMQGAPFAQGRRTATEVRTSFDVGTLKLRRMLMDLRGDLARAAKKRWALIELFRVRPKGVLELYREGKQYVLADEEIDEQGLTEYAQQFIGSEGMDAQQFLMERDRLVGEFELVNGGIPGVKRDDIKWRANGSDVIPDKHAELQKLDGFAPYLQFLQFAREDERIWYFLKVRLQLMGRHDWERFIGENPRVRMEKEQFMQAMQMMNEAGRQQQGRGGAPTDGA